MSESNTRLLNWREMVLKAQGDEQNAPEVVYRFGVERGLSAREFRSTDNSDHGVYERD